MEQFQLEDMHRVWILEEQPPPLTETYSGRYHYERPQMPNGAFFHYFHHSTSATHATARWIKHLPKKLHASILTQTPQPTLLQIAVVPRAWGILLEEELDQFKVLWIVVVPLLLTTIIVTVVWSICSGSRNEGLTAGALAATILTVGIVSIYKAFEQG